MRRNQPAPSALYLHRTLRKPFHHGWLYRRLVSPLLALLKMGASPQRLAWSIAAGVLVGINPMLGTTTLLCLAVAFVFRLNVAASQLINHLMYPFELLLVVPFIHLGSRIFHTEPMPLTPALLLHAARTHPIALTRQLWLWEWHALLVWLAVALIAMPFLALLLTPPLRRLLLRGDRDVCATLPVAHRSGSIVGN